MHIQFGAHWKRYCCTIGRQISLGKPTQRMLDIYQVARDAVDSCIDVMKPDVPATVPHEAAKNIIKDISTRYHSRFFVQVGHETMYASSGNKHFFTK